jgi:hypothetical protein
VSAVLYFVPLTISKSSLSPRIAALLILTLRVVGDVRYTRSNTTVAQRQCLPIQERKQIQNTQPGQNVPINLGHQLALGCLRKRRQLQIRLEIGLAFAIVDRYFGVWEMFCAGTSHELLANTLCDNALTRGDSLSRKKGTESGVRVSDGHTWDPHCEI